VAESETRRPFTVWQAILFQAVNPKAWIMAITAAAVFVPRDTPISHLIVVVGGLFLAVNVPCVSVWAMFGSGMRHLLLRPTYRRVFNLTMAALLVLTAILSLRG
jgi:threonine/homoserine/homoserine lactone efflux protein